MSAFAQRIALDAPRPLAIEVLKPEHFCSDWQNVPHGEVAVGVKLLSESELQQVLAEAAREVQLLYPDGDPNGPLMIKAYEDALVRLAVGRCATNPNDARDPYFAASDEMVGAAWPSGTIRRIWDTLERVTIAHSPVAEPAHDDDVRALMELIGRGMVDKMMPARQLRTRKLLAFLLAELRAVENAVG